MFPASTPRCDALAKRGIKVDAFWAAGRAESRFANHPRPAQAARPQDAALGAARPRGRPGHRRRTRASRRCRRGKAASPRLAAREIGCSLALYNHGGWFGEPENQLAIIARLDAQEVDNVGIVYNFHHGHEHLDRFPALLNKMVPYLRTINLNGMEKDGDRHGRKILPLGQGDRDLELLRAICASGYIGPIGILGHTQDDAEERLRDNLDGLDWLVASARGHAAGATAEAAHTGSSPAA